MFQHGLLLKRHISFLCGTDFNQVCDFGQAAYYPCGPLFPAFKMRLNCFSDQVIYKLLQASHSWVLGHSHLSPPAHTEVPAAHVGLEPHSLTPSSPSLRQPGDSIQGLRQKRPTATEYSGSSTAQCLLCVSLICLGLKLFLLFQ